MVWQQWLLIVTLVLGSAGSVALIGEQRKPITPGMALASLIINAGLIWIVVSI